MRPVFYCPVANVTLPEKGCIYGGFRHVDVSTVWWSLLRWMAGV